MLRPQIRRWLDPREFITSLTAAVEAPPQFLDDEALERRRRAVLAAFRRLDDRVNELLRSNRWTLIVRGAALAALTLLLLGATAYSVVGEAIAGGVVAGAGSFASVLLMLQQVRALERERVTLHTVVAKRDGQLAAATTEAELKAIAGAVVADLDALDKTGAIVPKVA